MVKKKLNKDHEYLRRIRSHGRTGRNMPSKAKENI